MATKAKPGTRACICSGQLICCGLTSPAPSLILSDQPLPHVLLPKLTTHLELTSLPSRSLSQAHLYLLLKTKGILHLPWEGNIVSIIRSMIAFA